MWTGSNRCKDPSNNQVQIFKKLEAEQLGLTEFPDGEMICFTSDLLRSSDGDVPLEFYCLNSNIASFTSSTSDNTRISELLETAVSNFEVPFNDNKSRLRNYFFSYQLKIIPNAGQLSFDNNFANNVVGEKNQDKLIPKSEMILMSTGGRSQISVSKLVMFCTFSTATFPVAIF
ncbi:uncharacterized protein EV154DRAFT_478800 [Mucor mucedo]|uniref:uncharacterized protein n=1 Tax=Mucor mucedo TaxID=29922 RepID=UPI002220931C|nr:uncharacterized protein EV154DRAFT_478800 [Mucor mucedo]KAI7894007.1 hypothetical protein EV154DRAFT_478800 [Mucor mucedo]